MVHDVTGVILVGGQSRRMGQDKAFMEVAGTPLFERVLAVFRGLFPQLLLVGDRPERFAAYGLPLAPDRFPGSALGGLYTGLLQATTPHIFVCACDVPYPSLALIRHLLALREGNDVVVPQGSAGLEPLFAVYGKGSLGPMERLLEEGNYRIYDCYGELKVRYVPPAEVAHIPDAQRSFLNLNTPAEAAAIHRKEQTMEQKALSFVSKSGTGKTTLLEGVIAELKGRGYRVGVVKHDAHRFDIDHPGKDSWRLTAAGADTMLISSPEKLALVKRHTAPPPMEELLATYFADVDIVLTEGFKKSALPKIELHRAERSPTLICRGEEHDPTLIAVASDAALELDVPLLDLNDPRQVVDFIVARFLS